MKTFFMGTHMPNWLGLTDVPLFVSHRRLVGRRTFPRALGPWALDSGAFTVLNTGEEFEAPAVYAAAVKRYAEEVGGLAWCAPQDWMCEPHVLAKTGLTVAVHQDRTIGSYLDLLAEGIPVIPVLQGWTLADYHRHADEYERRGIDLAPLPTVGAGSVCRRQNTTEIEAIVTSLAARGYRIHGFGVKTDGLARYMHALTSADSLAWSLNARMKGPQAGCPHGKDATGSCGNCLRYALQWRADLLAGIPDQQLSLGVAA